MTLYNERIRILNILIADILHIPIREVQDAYNQEYNDRSARRQEKVSPGIIRDIDSSTKEPFGSLGWRGMRDTYWDKIQYAPELLREYRLLVCRRDA